MFSGLGVDTSCTRYSKLGGYRIYVRTPAALVGPRVTFADHVMTYSYGSVF